MNSRVARRRRSRPHIFHRRETAARERGRTSKKEEGGKGGERARGWAAGKAVENCDGQGREVKVYEARRERNMSCSLYPRRSHVISAVIGLGYRYVCIMPR